MCIPFFGIKLCPFPTCYICIHCSLFQHQKRATATMQYHDLSPQDMTKQKGRCIDGLPPTQAALLQHTKRAAYQAGHCWAQTMIATPELLSPSEWGWNRNENGGWKICWTTLPGATEACREQLRYGCKKGCMGLCKSLKAGFHCTALCYCGGLCARC